MDERPAKIMPGRKARFAGKQRIGLERSVDESGLSEQGIEERDAETSKDEFVGLFGGRRTAD